MDEARRKNEEARADKARVHKILDGDGDGFEDNLLRLFVKADSENQRKLRVSFPEVAKRFDNWFNGV